jgi:hypothetical protein
MFPDLHRLRAWTRSEVAALHPGCFALVMATGIISNGLFLGGHRGWSDLLFGVMIFAWPGLILLTQTATRFSGSRATPTRLS